LPAPGAVASAPPLSPLACLPPAWSVPAAFVLVEATPPDGSALPWETASVFCSGLETLTIGSSWNTCAETRTTKTAIAIPIKVTPERAPTR
jgi:hypothetical protein